MCVILDSLISREQISQIATLARANTGNTKLALGFKDSKSGEAFIMESHFSINSAIKDKIESLLPNAVVKFL